MQNVSCPSREHFQNLYGKTTGLSRGVHGRDGVVHGRMSGLHCAPVHQGAALPRWIRAVSQDRDRGRCDHDPILVQMVEKCMCVRAGKPAPENHRWGQKKGENVKSSDETESARIAAASRHPQRSSDNVGGCCRSDRHSASGVVGRRDHSASSPAASESLRRSQPFAASQSQTPR